MPMAHTTFHKRLADFWKEHDGKVEHVYKIDGIDYWTIEVPEDNPHQKDPAVVQFVLEERMQYQGVIRKRFAPTLYTVVVGGVVAVTPFEGANGMAAMPVARSKEILQTVFTKPDKGQEPEYMKLNKEHKLFKTLKQVSETGVGAIAYFVDDMTVEGFDMRLVLLSIAPRVISPNGDGDKNIISIDTLRKGGRPNGSITP